MASNRVLLASVQKGLLSSFSQQSAAAHLRKATTLLSRTTGQGSEKPSWTQAAYYSTASPATRPAQNTGSPQVQLNSVGSQWETNFAAQPAQAAFPNAAYPNVAYTDSLLRDNGIAPEAMATAVKEELSGDTPAVLRFDDPEAAFSSHSNIVILRSLAVFTICGIKPLVKYADTCLRLAKRAVGSTLVNGVVKRTFFKHFCAGEDGDSIKPTMSYLHQNGIGGILDYAAESDTDAEGGPASRQIENELIVARTFDYEGEAACEGHMHTFIKAIQAAAASEGQGFAAIKVTALGQPKLLERVSASLVAIQNLFRTFDADLDGVITREDFETVYNDLFDDGTPRRMKALFKYLDRDERGVVDYLSWSRRVSLADIPLIVKHCRTKGPVAMSALNSQELQLLQNMVSRLSRLAETAAASNVRMMIDAEHSYFQPAIDHACMEVQRKFNKREPVIYNTYQCYLTDSHNRLVTDMERANREGFFFGAKLVRGAYMFLERERAEKMDYQSPVFDTIQQTHDNYNRCVDEVLVRVASSGAEVMVATHNQDSIEHTVKSMAALSIKPPSTSGVFFGQLLGMADHLTFTLGRAGYRSYKYVPFGPVDEVMPYLIRRAQENSDLMGGVGHEMAMLRRELKRRLLTGNPIARYMARSRA